MKFSVIIPAFNSEKTILRSINSIINQTYDDVELIVIDDGSFDNTEKVVKDIKLTNSSKIPIFYEKIKNSGPSTARNIGIDLSTGEYVCFLDSDDTYDVNLFNALNEHLVLFKSDICFFGWKEIKNSRIFSSYRQNFSYLEKDCVSGMEAAILKFKKKIWLNNCNEVYKRDILIKNKIRYLEDVYSGEDTNFIYKALISSEKVTYIPFDYFNNYYRNDSLMHSSFNFRFLTSFKAINDLCNYVRPLSKDVQIIPNSLLYLLKIEISKKMIDSLKWYQCFSFVRLNKKHIPNIKKNKLTYLNKKQKVESFVYELSKIMFFYMTKIYRLVSKKKANE